MSTSRSRGAWSPGIRPTPFNRQQPVTPGSGEKEEVCHHRQSPVSVPRRAGGGAGVGGSPQKGHDKGDGEAPAFDLCSTPAAKGVQLKAPLLAKNREKRLQEFYSKNGPQITRLRPGMILLKKYLSPDDQVSIVRRCRELGLGPGGFYQPHYADGAKLHLLMMCLGKNWDPETRKYEERRSIDGAEPPEIPEQFRMFVERAMQASHDFIKQASKCSTEVELPGFSPDLCIINYYSSGGKLGLHQDRDERDESLKKGLPVVSFSLGDSAEFLYGDDRNVDMAEKVELESGDIVIFGGQSRHIFHGVTKILPKTAPKSLIEETNMRPGRLNLTFRQY